MANAIKIGTKDVPIIEEQHLTGYTEPQRKPNLSFAGHTLEAAYNDSDAAIGTSSWNGETWESNPSIGYGQTDCNGMTVFFLEPYPTTQADVPAWASEVQFIGEDLEPPSAVDTQVTAPIVNPVPQSGTFDYGRVSKMVAIAYDFPEATTVGEKRKGYEIFIIEGDTVRRHGDPTSPTTESYNIIGRLWIDIPFINSSGGYDYWYEEIPDPGPEQPFDPSDPTPYNPNKDDTSDLIGLPPDPPFGITSAGFIKVYKPTSGGLQGLGEVLFPTTHTPTDLIDAVATLEDVIMNQNLINYVIDCHVIPVSPTYTTSEEITVGGRDTGIYAPRVTSDYVNVSCGSLSLSEYYGGFQDYQCTVSKLFLPFIGFVDVIPEFWQAGTISVDYKFNVIDGSFMAFVRSVSSKSNLNGSVIASYSGNACMHLPLTGLNYATMVNGLINAGAAAAGGGGAGAIFGSALSALNIVAKGADVQQSNGYNATASILGVRKPYLQIERLKPAWSTKYRHDKGLPSNIATSLNNISGFTVIEDIDLTGLPFTQGEVEELRGLLKDGVYF